MERFARELEACRKRVYLHLRRYVTPEDARDLVQETMVRAWRGREHFQGDKPLVNWLYRIATRVALDFRRYRGRRLQAMSLDAPVEWLDGMDWADTIEDEKALAEFGAVGIPEIIQEALAGAKNHGNGNDIRACMLIDLEGLDYNEAAEVLHVPLGTIRSRVHRGRKRLIPALKDAVAA
jgi:RNA polymerase sigma-70 factor (ECF subfamily)